MTKITEKQIEILQDFANQNNIDFVDNYSGRGMFGRTCIGFSGNFDPFTLGFNLAQYLLDVEDDDDSEILLSEIFYDGSELDEAYLDAYSLGLGSIVYFPDITTM